MRNVLLIIVTFSIAGLSGYAHGLFIDRWGTPANVLAVASAFEQLSVDIDGWTEGESRGISDRTRKAAGAEGYFSRSYTHDKTGATVNVTILCGRPGPISLHTPDVCFVNAGMQQLAGETRTVISRDGKSLQESEVPAEFWNADFRPPPSNPGPPIRAFWAWSPDGQSWSTPDDPRMTYSREPYLYRFYFTAASDLFLAAAEDEQFENPVQAFMPAFLERFAESTRTPETE